MADVRLNLTTTNNLDEGIQNYIDSLKELEGAVEGYNDSANKAFSDVSKSTKKAEKSVEDQTSSLKKNEKAVDNLSKEQKKLERQSKKTFDTKPVKQYGDSIGGLGKILKTAGLVVLFQQGLQAIRSFIVGGINAYQTQVQAVAKVQQAIESTNGAAGRSLEQLKDQASELQRETLFGDEQILNGVTAQLLTFTNIANEQFDRTQTVALDLATVLDGDLQSASIQLGKALNDPIANLSALSRSGIQFSREQQDTIKALANTNRLAEAQTIILDELERQYGGQAKAAAVANGGFKQTANILGDLQEAVGGRLVGSLQNYNVSVQEAALRTIEWVENSTAADLIFTAFRASIDGVIDVFTQYGSAVDRLSTNFNSLLRTLGLFQEEGEKATAVADGLRFVFEVSAVPFKIFVGLIDNVVTGFKAIVEGGKVAIDFLSDFSIDEGTEAFKRSFNDFENSVTQVIQDSVNPFVNLFAENQKEVEEASKESATNTAKVYGKALRDQQVIESDKEKAQRIKATESFLNEILKLEEEGERSRIEALSGAERVRAEEEFRNKQIDNLEENLRAQQDALNLSESERIASERRIVEVVSGLRKASEEKASEELRQIRIDEATKDLNLRKGLAEAEAEAIRIESVKSGADLEDAEEEKQRKILEIQLKYARERLDLLRRTGTEGSELEIKNLENLVGDLEVQIDQASKITPEGKPLLQQIFGVGDEEYAAIQSAVSELANVAVSAIQESLTAAIESNRNYVSVLNERIDETEAALDREVELREKGLANNVDAERQALDELKIRREQALVEQEKLQKRQAILDGLTQASSLATAGAKVLAAESAKGALGVAFGITAIATLLSFFTRLKSQTSQISQLEKGGFGDEFGIVEGRNHAQGGESFLSNIEVERKEGWSVYNQRTMRKYGKSLRPFTEKINKGDAEGAIAELISGTGVNLRPDARERASDIALSYSRINRNDSSLKEISSLKSELIEMKNILKEWPKEFADPATGEKYIKQGNRRVKVKERR